MNSNWPQLSEIIGKDSLPHSIQCVGTTIDDLLKDLRYRNLLIETAADNSAGFYGLTLVAKELSLDLFGSGLTLIFFPAEDETAATSDIAVAFEYSWLVLKYLPEFETLRFDQTTRAFFDIFLELVDITEEEFLIGIIDALIDDPAPYQTLIAKLKTWSDGSTTPLASVTLANQPAGYSEIEYILQQVPATVDIFWAAFEAVAQDVSDIEQSIDKLVTLFRTWLGDITRSDIEELLLPQFALEIKQVSMAIEVPRSVLIPLGSDNEQIDDVTKHSRLKFTAGGVRYDSETGFAIDIDKNIAATFTKSMIPHFGITLEFDDIQIDLSRTTNITSADAEGRPVDFMGVSVGNAVIGLPKKWFANYPPSSGNPVTLGIVGRDLLIGTGGFSGTVGLEVIAAGKPKPTKEKHTGPEELEFVLGKQPAPGSTTPRKGFKIGFSTFDMKFRQNVLLESTIKGSLTIPKFDSEKPIDIELFLAHDGDFKVTASVVGGHLFKVGNVFSFLAKSLSVEKNDDRVFAETTGNLSFKNNPFLGKIITEPIHIEKLRIHSDGSFEIDGGTIPIPESVIIPLGPAKIAITAIHCGSHEQEYQGVMRKYRYWGFDGGLNVNPGGIDASGDGFKYYYTVDDDTTTGLDHHDFLRIEGIAIDMAIPGTASRENAALLLKGYLALKDPVYKGSLSFQLPQMKISGGASMFYNTDVPAWLVQAWLDLPKPIPVGATGLGVYGFNGVFGLRYIAAKEAVTPALNPDASWGDYYRAAPRGVKYLSPPGTKDASNPFSVGAGVSLATAEDGGRAFTSQLFLLVSIPNLILLEGRADVMATKRVGPDDDPPYYAYLALSPESVELGAGVSYRVPKETGAILDLNAVFEAAFFFHNRNAWYIHFGTKGKPATARVIKMFDGYAYLMLSASGIEAGAGVHYDFAKKYGPVAVSAHAYLDLWGYVSFERPQVGGGIALGGSVDIKVMGVGFCIELAAGMTVEAPTPFRVAGYAKICVTVNLKIKKFHKCVNLEFVWEHPDSVDTSPVWALTDTPNAPPAIGIHMASGATYAVEFSANPDSANPPNIPLDTYIDVKFSKPVNPSALSNMSARIGGFTNPPSDNIEIVPPKYGSRIVTHSYGLKDVKLEVLSAAGNWIDYHPFVALAPEALVNTTVGANLAGLPIGFWQKEDLAYTQIRFLALTPFNYMEPVGNYRPEEMGLTAQTIFCQGRERTEQCLLWDEPTWDKSATYAADTNYYRAGILYRIEGSDAAALPLPFPPLAPISLGIKPGARAIFSFSRRAASCKLTLFTNAPQITIHFQRRKSAPFSPGSLPGEITIPYAAAEFEDVAEPTIIARSALVNPVIYDNSAGAIDRIIIETPVPNAQLIANLEEKIALRQEDLVRATGDWRAFISDDIATLKSQLDKEHNKTCVVDKRFDREQSAELTSLLAEIDSKSSLYDSACWFMPATPTTQGFGLAVGVPEDPLRPRTMSGEECTQLAAEIAALKKRALELDPGIRFISGPTRSQLPAAVDLASDDTGPRRPIDGGFVAGEMDPRFPIGGDSDFAGAGSQFPTGWQCGTFVHEICWLSEEDSQYNQTIPAIAAIEADFDSMRTAVESTIAPIWRPNQRYRITLKVSDSVTAASSPPVAEQLLYVHFQTKGPLGHFEVPLDPVNADVPDDGRPEVPERFLKFYIDMERSYPNPSGKLLYAKPLYYNDVVLQLFLTKPYAYHFFADWPAYPPGNSSLNAESYAIELRIKDPAEAQLSSDTADHTQPIVTSPLIGAQTWIVDPSPRHTEDLKILNNFQQPDLLGGADHGTACLTTGGAPIIPAAMAFTTKINLEPNKLYTAVVLNKDLSEAKEAEVARYPFKTSEYADFATHIDSCKLKDDAGNERQAVFKVSHNLANAADAPPIYDAALKIIKRERTADSNAYPDFFDRLMFECLKLEPLPPAATLEFNFVENALKPEIYGLWLRSPEPLNDSRIPPSDLLAAIVMSVSGVEQNARILLSKDCCQAFVMIEGATFPTTDISFKFAYLGWDNRTQMYVAKETINTESFSSP